MASSLLAGSTDIMTDFRVPQGEGISVVFSDIPTAVVAVSDIFAALSAVFLLLSLYHY
jgi:hypothetical protein